MMPKTIGKVFIHPIPKYSDADVSCMEDGIEIKRTRKEMTEMTESQLNEATNGRIFLYPKQRDYLASLIADETPATLPKLYTCDLQRIRRQELFIEEQVLAALVDKYGNWLIGELRRLEEISQKEVLLHGRAT